MLIFHKSIKDSLTNRPKRKQDRALWVSDFGRNPYDALSRIMTGTIKEFDYSTLLKMDGGNALESFSLRQVAENLDRPIQTQFPLFDDIWTGYADLVIGHGTEDIIIYDHKGSCGKWWDYKASLPRAADCCQVWLYGNLYAKQYGIMPRLGIYYRGWGAWAEFELRLLYHDDGEGYIRADGIVTDEKGIEEKEVTRFHKVDPTLLLNQIERLYRTVQTDKFTLEDLANMKPEDEDWDYAARMTKELREQ